MNNAEMTKWQDLDVYTADGEYWGTLGDLVKSAPANLDSAEISESGKIECWEGFFLSAEGEGPDWDTPAEPVNWAGLGEALGR